ncbi:MAG: hypothetical protein QOG38_2273 [Hyphomicrobiales bacterium]|nr:hypothetical protein [Hyphomicrobiales bacterium]
MAVLTAFLHLVAFAAITGMPKSFGGGIFLFVTAVPVLILHVLIWAVARLSAAWGIIAAIVLNLVWAAAGWLYWSVNINQALISNRAALLNTIVFAAAGLATAAILIGWLRFTRRRTANT